MDHCATGPGTVESLEAELRELSHLMMAPRPGECLPCYLLRMVGDGCRGHTVTDHWRRMAAPNAVRLRRMLSDLGACCCECQVFAWVYDLRPAFKELFVEAARRGDLEPPRCRGVRPGSVQPRVYWERKLFCESHQPKGCW